MKKLNSFLKLVEIRTKVASLFPFAIGTLLVNYRFGTIDWVNFCLMFFSLINIDLATTGFNHYFDYKRAILKSGYHYQHHNPVSAGEMQPETALRLLIALVVMGSISGVILAVRTDWVVLMLGMLAFGIGIGYSFGPLPISRTIMGEVFSGIFMGGLIPFIAFYIHMPSGALWTLNLEGDLFTMAVNVQLFIQIALTCLPLVFLISNIMLANNICDAEEDLSNLRYTLPVSIGRKKSLILFQMLVIGAYLSVAIAIATSYLPLWYGLNFLSLPMLFKQTKRFVENPQKAVTFKYSVKNFLIFSLVDVIALSLMVLTRS